MRLLLRKRFLMLVGLLLVLLLGYQMTFGLSVELKQPAMDLDLNDYDDALDIDTIHSKEEDLNEHVKESHVKLAHFNILEPFLPFRLNPGFVAPSACPKVFIGIMTTASRESTERRHLLRMLYKRMMYMPIPQRQFVSDCDASGPFLVKDIVTLKFVVGAPSHNHSMTLDIEQNQYHDLLLLDMAENMNDGKTLEFFKTLSRGSRYDYVTKADDDAFVHLPNLARLYLNIQHRVLYQEFSSSIYMGMICVEPRYDMIGYATGMLYAFSWDLVRHISTSRYALANQVGPEDIQSAKWVAASGLNVTLVNQDAFSAFPNPAPFVNHYATLEERPIDFFETLILVHPCKDDTKLLHIMSVYFPL